MQAETAALALWQALVQMYIPVDSSVIDSVLQRIALSCLAHITIDGGIHYEFLAQLLLLYGFISNQS